MKLPEDTVEPYSDGVPAREQLRYRICTRCVMDTSDPDIVFEADGVCHHCQRHQQVMAQHHGTPADLESIVEKIKREGHRRRYDCVIGVSGGVDSTYTAWLVKQLGLRPLAVHLDNGWNSDIAVRNIANTLKTLEIDLDTCVLNWEEFRDIQRAFLLASVPDVDIPTDHAIIASLCGFARKYRIPAIVTGHNDRTESHLPAAWSRGHIDYGYIRAVHSHYGKRRLKSFPRISFVTYLWMTRNGFGMIPLLNNIAYSRQDARETIARELGWTPYGGKHHESVFTRWYQGVYLPDKFCFDKRRTHLSSLVSSGEMIREDALAALTEPTYDRDVQRQDTEYVGKKLGFSVDEFREILQAGPRRFGDYNSYSKAIDRGLLRLGREILRPLRRLGVRQQST
jgi:N-acetyl sugar amidotransferase